MASKKNKPFYAYLLGLLELDWMSEVIPFDEIVPGATVRVVTIDGLQYLSIRDIIMCVCGKDGNHSAEIWRRLSESKKEEVNPFANKASEVWHRIYQFPGRGQQYQPVITLPGSVKLVMLLPGKRAKLYRTKFAEIISRYLDGDQTLCLEIDENRTVGQKQSYARFAHGVESAIQEDETNEMPQIHYVYATKSSAFPDLIKIGRTIDMSARLSSLNSACAPAPHTIVAMATTFDMYRDEDLAHQYFAESRREGEFFQITEEEIKAYFSSVIMPRFQEELLDRAKTAYSTSALNARICSTRYSRQTHFPNNLSRRRTSGCSE